MKKDKVKEHACSAGILYVKNMLLVLIISVILLAVCAVFMYTTDISDRIVSIFLVCAYLIPNFIGGWCMGKGVGEKKFLWGLFLGIGYFIFLLLVSYIGNGFFLGDLSKAILVFFLCSFSGMFGGMLS